jgi:hypothetical protein
MAPPYVTVVQTHQPSVGCKNEEGLSLKPEDVVLCCLLRAATHPEGGIVSSAC